VRVRGGGTCARDGDPHRGKRIDDAPREAGSAVWGVSSPDDDPEDAFQVVFARLAEVIDLDADGPASLRRWVVAVAHRVLFDRHRRRRTAPAGAEGLHGVDMAEIARTEGVAEGTVKLRLRRAALASSRVATDREQVDCGEDPCLAILRPRSLDGELGASIQLFVAAPEPVVPDVAAAVVGARCRDVDREVGLVAVAPVGVAVWRDARHGSKMDRVGCCGARDRIRSKRAAGLTVPRAACSSSAFHGA
jgi:hypothetical protein